MGPLVVDDEEGELSRTVSGKPLAARGDGIWKGLVLFGKADFEALTVGWGLSSYNSGDEICGFCKANRSNRSFTNLLEDKDPPRLRRETHPSTPPIS